MTEVYRKLDPGLLDYVFGVVDRPKERWASTFLDEEPLLYVARAGTKQTKSQSVDFKDIANQTYVMVPHACGLSRATRALFRSQRSKLHEYSGEAMSYQVLQDWAALNIGSAILPKSKVADNERAAFSINGFSRRCTTVGVRCVGDRCNLFS